MAQALPQDEDEDELTIPAGTEAASAAHTEPAPPPPAQPAPAPTTPATPPTWANRANADQVDGLGTAGGKQDESSPSKEAIARRWKERMRRRLL
ncbi:hypothetical protein FS749_010328 [Ceratobasidium sp. UAMH 11750]|nr:hypothetical protein FS749_010328 [Ceratobasidium sp. UAMH 11750]